MNSEIQSETAGDAQKLIGQLLSLFLSKVFFSFKAQLKWTQSDTD